MWMDKYDFLMQMYGFIIAKIANNDSVKDI